MASHSRRPSLPSDPEFLLELMHELPDESGSKDDFDGYLEPDDGPVVHRGSNSVCNEQAHSTPLTRTRSLESMIETRPQLDESPMPTPSLSPTLPMQVELEAAGSPTYSPMEQTRRAPPLWNSLHLSQPFLSELV